MSQRQGPFPPLGSLFPSRFPPHSTSNTPPPSKVSPSDPDAAIRLTDTDALLARWSAVQKGYITDDPWVKYLISTMKKGRAPPGSPEDPNTPRPPLINVGTYLRGWAMDTLTWNWLEAHKIKGEKVQIVSLGAGSDTRYWRLVSYDKGNDLS
jgi:[phosphatase 2A protein]-leucine-carboxy methyltransferase